jgi:hypothetical protein
MLPVEIDGWKRAGDDRRFDAAGVEALGTELYLSRTYVHRNKLLPPIQLHIAYYTGQIDAVPHVPDRCMVAGGYVPLTPEPMTLKLEMNKEGWQVETAQSSDELVYPTLVNEGELIRLPIGEFELRTTEFSHPQLGDQHVFAGYYFIANGKTTAYPEQIRLLSFDRTSSHSYYCKIQFTIQGSSQFTTEKFNTIVSSFSSSLLPEIMRCLPDWVEVSQSKNNNDAQVNQEP